MSGMVAFGNLSFRVLSIYVVVTLFCGGSEVKFVYRYHTVHTARMARKHVSKKSVIHEACTHSFELKIRYCRAQTT